jgi:hypothetical protein
MRKINGITKAPEMNDIIQSQKATIKRLEERVKELEEENSRIMMGIHSLGEG